MQNIKISKLPDNEEKTMSQMKQWLYTTGAYYDSLKVVTINDSYRGVISTKPISKKERIVFIPRHQVITLELAKQSTICKEIIIKNVEIFSPKHTYLAIFLLQQLMKGSKSHWKLYLDILPKDHSSFPINYSNQELIQLIGSPFLLQIHEKVFDLKRDYDRIAIASQQFKKYKFGDFCWARTMVGSRIFGLFIDGVKTDILAPFADMLNHKLPKETSWNFIQAEGGFTIESLVDLPAGVQICDSYGKKCNSRYLLNYGFVMQNNPQNTICLKIDFQGDHRAKKLQMIKRKDGIKILRISKSMDDNNFYESMGFLRFNNIDDYNQLAVLEKISGIKVTNQPYQPAKTPPITIQLQIKIWQNLQKLSENALKQYPTTLQQDRQILSKQQLKYNQRNILILRSGQKQLFNYYIKICQQIITVLKSGYVLTFDYMNQHRDRPWCRYVHKILTIMPHQKSKEVLKINFAPLSQPPVQGDQEQLSDG